MILLVEDNELIQDLVVDVTRDCGMAVFIATRSSQALAALDHYPEIRLVLMDFKLAGPTSGIQCAVHIRELPPPQCDLPIFALTGGMYSQDADLLPRARFDEVFQKPFGVQELLAAIERYCPTNRLPPLLFK